MHKHQAAGTLSLLLGLAILFLLRDPLYAFIVVVLDLIGIFVGILLVVIGIALIFGGGWMKRRARWGWGSTSFPTPPRD